jgi:hypothetical protein
MQVPQFSALCFNIESFIHSVFYPLLQKINQWIKLHWSHPWLLQNFRTFHWYRAMSIRFELLIHLEKVLGSLAIEGLAVPECTILLLMITICFPFGQWRIIRLVVRVWKSYYKMYLESWKGELNVGGRCVKKKSLRNESCCFVLVYCRLFALFAWLISHQPAVLFSQNKPASSNQSTVLFSQNKPAPAIRTGWAQGENWITAMFPNCYMIHNFCYVFRW